MVRSWLNPSVSLREKGSPLLAPKIYETPLSRSIARCNRIHISAVTSCVVEIQTIAPAAYFCIMSWTNSLSGVR